MPVSPGVVKFDPATRTLTAIGMGSVPLGITMGDKQVQRYRERERTRPLAAGGKMVIEPGLPVARSGQAERLTGLRGNAHRREGRPHGFRRLHGGQ